MGHGAMGQALTGGSDLQVLAGGPALLVQIAGESVAITPVRVAELERFAHAITPLLDDLAAATDETLDVVGMLRRHPGAVIDAVVVGARKPRAWVDALGVDELVELAGAIAAVNADFFTRAVIPALTRAMTRLAGPAAGSPLPPA
jgi:hypothetical protein